VQAVIPIENTAIQRVLEKNGFTSEGVIRKNRFHRGAWRDSSLFSIIREEWNNPTQMPSHKYYTDEHPKCPWSRSLYQKRTGKPFDENEFKNDLEASPELQALSLQPYYFDGPLRAYSLLRGMESTRMLSTRQLQGACHLRGNPNHS
jgi:hypothetical protein